MSEQTENHTLRLLQEMRAENRQLHNDTITKLNRLGDDMRDLRSDVSTLKTDVATLSRRLDRLDERVDRIERRLDLTDTPVE